MALFTSDDLLLYLYHETTPAQTAAIEAALENDLSLREQLAELQDALPPVKDHLAPSSIVVNRILAYASGTPLEKLVQEQQPSA